MGSAEGGVEIEEVAVERPRGDRQRPRRPAPRAADWQAREMAFTLGPRRRTSRPRWRSPRASSTTMLVNDADLVEINPLAIVREHGADGNASSASSVSTPRSRSTTPRCPAIPSSRRCATSTKRIPPTSRRAQAGHQLHPPRRHDRLHGQRRRPGDDDDGPRQARRRRARELPRHRRRRRGRQGRRRDAAHPRRPEGRGDPGQHLRRHHPRRRGGARPGRGARPAGRATCRWSCASSARTPTEAARDPRGGAVRDGRQPRRGGREGGRGRARRRGAAPREHPRRARDAAPRPGHHRPRGRVPRPGDAGLRHERSSPA